MAVFEDQRKSTAPFDELESAVRSYCRSWPVVFDRAAGSWLYDEDGRAYLDFFTGASALNYGHNNLALRQALLDYLTGDRVVHSLDTFTAAKRDFLVAFEELILRPRGLDYRLQFPGPAGTNAVEAALKLARKVTGRTQVICFTNAFHGTSLGSLTVTASALHRGAAGVPLEHTTRLPFGDRDFASDFELLDSLLEPVGEDRPAAVIVEVVQGEGGVNVARPEWLRGLAQRCASHDVLLIVDDIQMGCGRTGPFFSFETAGIEPDIVCLSKSLSGYGLPLALTLIRPEIDIWEPGEHNGTFRGFNPAFVTATAALETYWHDDALERATASKGHRIAMALEAIAAPREGVVTPRGIGMAHGLAFEDPQLAASVSSAAFELGLLVERAGPQDEVVKLLPPLTVSQEELIHGLTLLARAVESVC